MNEVMHNKKRKENAKCDKRKTTQNETNKTKWNEQTNQIRPIWSNPHLKVAQQRLEIGHGQEGLCATAATAGTRRLWNTVLRLHQLWVL